MGSRESVRQHGEEPLPSPLLFPSKSPASRNHQRDHLKREETPERVKIKTFGLSRAEK